MADHKREAARLVIQTLPALMQAVASEMRHAEHGLPMPHFGALMMLSHCPSLTLSELAERRKVSLPTMSKTVGILESNGWVERVADESDRRKADLHLTPSGEAVVHHMEEHMVDLLARFFEPLTSDEVARLTDGVGVLRHVAEVQTSERTATEGSPA